MRWVRVLAPEEKTLIVIREPDTIEFFFSKDNRRWRITSRDLISQKFLTSMRLYSKILRL